MTDLATDVMLLSLGAFEVGSRPLVVDDESGRLAKAMTAPGRNPARWHRRACDAGVATPWPSAGLSSSALIRMPKAKAALDYALHAAASVVPPRAPIMVFGANDEGIRSAALHLEAVADDVATQVTRNHCRVLMGKRKAAIANHRDRMSAWRTIGEITLHGQKRPWISYPGLFAKGTLDAGTALLLGNLPDLSGGGASRRILDFAAGTGVVAAAIRQSAPAAAIDLIEIDTLALEAARENRSATSDGKSGPDQLPATQLIAGRSLADARGPYDLIISNPPIHDGVHEHHGVLEALIAGAPAFLNPHGELRIVVQRRVKASASIEAAFGTCEMIAETSQFRVLSGRRR